MTADTTGSTPSAVPAVFTVPFGNINPVFSRNVHIPHPDSQHCTQCKRAERNDDGLSSLGMLTINSLAAANRVLIPVQAEYLPAKGLELLLQTVNKVKRQINPRLQIDGILMTMADSRTNFAKEISNLLRETYGRKIKVFRSEIPHSVRAKETTAEGKSIFQHNPSGKVAEGYRSLAQEVITLEKQREKDRADVAR